MCVRANRYCNFRSQKCAQERNREDVGYKSISDTSNNGGERNLFKIIQKIPEQQTGKARNQGTTQNSRTGHCSHTAE